jgi:hypothetical protein
MGGVAIDERAKHPVDIAGLRRMALKLEPRLDHLAGAAADQVARIGVVHGPPLLAREHHVQCVDQVRGGVDKRAVEVEYDGQGHVRAILR